MKDTLTRILSNKVSKIVFCIVIAIPVILLVTAVNNDPGEIITAQVVDTTVQFEPEIAEPSIPNESEEITIPKTTETTTEMVTEKETETEVETEATISTTETTTEAMPNVSDTEVSNSTEELLQ